MCVVLLNEVLLPYLSTSLSHTNILPSCQCNGQFCGKTKQHLSVTHIITQFQKIYLLFFRRFILFIYQKYFNFRNFRDITLLPVASKIVERDIFNININFLLIHKFFKIIVCFLKWKLTITALYRVLDTLYKSCKAIFIDLRKTFIR